MLGVLVTAAALADEPPADAIVPPTVVRCDVPRSDDTPGPARAEVLLTIDERGVVREAVPLSGDTAHANALLTAVTACTFTPATDHGAPIAVQIPFAWDWPAPEPPRLTVHVTTASGDAVPSLDVRIGDHVLATDATGTAATDELPPDTYTVGCLSPRWECASTSAALVPDHAVVVELVARPVPGDEAVGRYVDSADPLPPRVIDAALARATPGTLGDPIRTLQSAPGVARTPLDAGWLIVRGGDPADTAVFLDGVRIPLLFHLGGLTSVLHPELVDTVRYMPGVFSARYGGATAGVVDVAPRAVSDETTASGGLNLAWTEAYAQHAAGPGNLAFAARRSWLDAALSVVVGHDGAQIAPRFADVAARYDLGDDSITAIAMRDTLDAPTGNGDTVQILQRSVIAEAHAAAAVGGGSLVATPAIVAQDRTIVTSGRDETESQWAPGARVEWTRRGPLSLVAGADGERRTYAVDRDGTSRSGAISHLDPYVGGTVGTDVRAEGGVRLDTLFVSGQTARLGLSPRGAVAWTAAPGLTFTLAGATLHRAPASILLVGYPEGPYLPLITARSASFGARYDGKVVSGELTAWRRDTHGLSGFDRDGSLGGGLLAHAYGVDGSARLELPHTVARIGLQFGRSLVAEEPGDGWAPSRFDQPVQVQVLAARDLGKGWMISGRWRYASGYALDPGANTAYDVLTRSEIDLASYTGGRLPAWHALDLRVARAWEGPRWTVEAFLDGQNVYDRRVPEPTINGIDDTQAVYAIGLPILPIFGVDGRFHAKPTR